MARRGVNHKHDRNRHGTGGHIGGALTGHIDHLGELAHELRARVQTAGGIDEHQVTAALIGLVEHVIAHARRIGAAVTLDNRYAGTLPPHIELLDGGGAEGVGRTDHHVLAAGSHGARDLTDRRGLAGTVNAHKQHAARRIGKRISLDGHKVLLKLLGQGTAKLRSGLEVLLGRGIAQVIGDLDSDLGAHVTHDEGVLQVLPKILVDLAAKVEDLVEGLAAALKSARESIEESHYAFTTFPVSRSSFCETTRLTPSACIETP